MYTVVTDDGPDTALGIFNRILVSFPELAELRGLIQDDDCKLAILMKEGELKLRGQHALGLACLPEAQGALKPLFAWMLEEVLGYHPDWIIILSADWWEEASAIDREALVCHEALHCGQLKDKYGDPRFSPMGGPVVGILPHDVEEFHAIARRYGSWTPDLVTFKAALNEGDRRGAASVSAGRDGHLSVSALKVVQGGKK